MWLHLNSFFFSFLWASNGLTCFPFFPFGIFQVAFNTSAFFSVKNESTRRIAWTNWLVQPLSRRVVFFFHMASLRRKENFAEEHCGVWYGARGSHGPGLAGCSCTKASLPPCSLRKMFLVHGQKSDVVMLAQLILIKYSSQAAAPRPQIWDWTVLGHNTLHEPSWLWIPTDPKTQSKYQVQIGNIQHLQSAEVFQIKKKNSNI